jgi:branched-subunit amino acid aminotransferase/4-amino-4-deoxychorismate lyase
VKPLRVELDGHPATAEDLGFLTVGGYGHFTAMQVRGGRTRGLDLHLSRLDAATRELFEDGLDGDLVRDRIRHALGDDIADASVRVNVFWPEDALVILVVVRPAAPEPSAPLSLRTVPYQRPVPHVKHLGGFGQTYYRRLAERDGFDEALLTTPDGVVSEGGITNVACYDGTTLIWPAAPALDGITMLLLERYLPGQGVPTRRAPVCVSDLPSYVTVVATNSRGIAAVERVDDRPLSVDRPFMKTLLSTYEAVPWDPI